jgi:hypothetical protein
MDFELSYTVMLFAGAVNAADAFGPDANRGRLHETAEDRFGGGSRNSRNHRLLVAA